MVHTRRGSSATDHGDTAASNDQGPAKRARRSSVHHHSGDLVLPSPLRVTISTGESQSGDGDGHASGDDDMSRDGAAADVGDADAADAARAAGDAGDSHCDAAVAARPPHRRESMRHAEDAPVPSAIARLATRQPNVALGVRLIKLKRIDHVDGSFYCRLFLYFEVTLVVMPWDVRIPSLERYG